LSETGDRGEPLKKPCRSSCGKQRRDPEKSRGKAVKLLNVTWEGLKERERFEVSGAGKSTGNVRAFNTYIREVKGGGGKEKSTYGQGGE